MNIRESAVHVTAKKIAYRQSKDGMVISFVLHPQEVPDKLATDPIGTSYMLALVEIDDATGQPRGGDAHEPAKPTVDTAPRSQATGGGARKSWGEMTPSAQAGLLCNDRAFQKYL